MRIPKDVRVIVAGGLNTDIVGLGVRNIVGEGELTLGGRLVIGPGGKSRNIAQMASCFLKRGAVAMIGRTSKDPFGLWKVPIRALKESGVHIGFVKVLPFHKDNPYPGVALIPVDTRGRNQIYVLPGANEGFSPHDVDEAAELFVRTGQNGGILALSLEIPLETGIRAVRMAKKAHMRVILDPGGLEPGKDYASLLTAGIFILKPNEHEARVLSGVTVKDFASAGKAAGRLLARGIVHVLITHGSKGGYFFSKGRAAAVPAPVLRMTGPTDETGCGDQVTAVLSAALSGGIPLDDAVKMAIVAGSIQFHRVGIKPVIPMDLQGSSIIG